MNYTENYHLPQWEETDRIMRTDFNQMCADLEAGIKEAKETADALPYVTGSYVGDYTANRKIFLGFRPSFVIVSGMISVKGNSALLGVPSHILLTAGGLLDMDYRFQIVDDGFIVQGGANKEYVYPALNDLNRVYNYIAFR